MVQQPFQQQGSPQANLYQQQLLKSAQQTYGPRATTNGLIFQQESPVRQESLYNGTRAPIYAPKPTYYPQQQFAPRPLYPQHSPAGLSVRQLSGSGEQQLAYPTQYAMHPAQLMTAQVSPYQQQQQHQQQQLQQQQQQLVQQHVDVRWPLPDDRLTLERARPTRLSDRESVSTASRFTQFDERRSITMRSQYTSAGASRHAHVGAFRLTRAALARLLGLSGPQSLLVPENSEPKAMLRRNINHLSPSLSAAAKQASEAPSRVTVIDSGEDQYFKRRVFRCQLALQRLLGALAAAFVLLSPVAMLLVPKMESVLRQREFIEEPTISGSVVTHAVGLTGRRPVIGSPAWRITDCGPECDGPLVGFVARLILLVIAYWALFFRPQTASLPRVDFQRSLLVALAALITLAYWLFFIFRLFDKRHNDFELQYATIVQFALSMLESLILLHYLAVVLLELRARKKLYCLKVVRSPDGASMYFSCGSLSVQKCAQLVLEKYHRRFPSFGPHAEQLQQLEDEIARASVAREESRTGNKSPARSRASSPVESQRGARTTTMSRRRSRGVRSPSNSPVRSTRGGRKRPLDEPAEQQSGEKETRVEVEAGANRSGETKKVERELESNSAADQSSDETASRLNKESSLETVRAAGSGEIVTTRRGQRSNGSSRTPLQEQRDETESVRSTRSRRSHRHREHRHHRERSQSRAREQHEPDRRRTNSSLAITMPPEDPLEEHEQKLRRRRLRLLAAVQEAFEQLKEADEDAGLQPVASDTNLLEPPQGQALPANQAARALYPRLARPLQKYLRLTRQTGRHNLQSIYEHLGACLLYKLGARTFLEKFLVQDPVWQQNETGLFVRRESAELNSWALLCDTLASRELDTGTRFVLKQGRVSLLVTVARLPHLSLSEEVLEPAACKYTLAPNSETSV